MLTAGRADFERTLEVDLQGVWRTVAPALDQVAARQGQVVVISSVYAFMNGMVAAPYAVAKAGVEALGRALRVELSIHGAGATVAHFGFIDTVMVQEAFDGDAEGSPLVDTLPAFVTRRLSPGQAAEAVVTGIERRAPRVIEPSWWRVLYHLRGLTGPLMDWVSTKDRRIIQALRDLEARP
jgi:NAD(P)-dependent dehydrogenase (short-subunit alcohol dehydrogenase family)